MSEGKIIQYYPGHMYKTKKEIGEIISTVDIVIEVVDSRIPYSSRIPDLKKITNNKQSIIVFSKYDLCDKVETDKWASKYESEGSIVIKSDTKNTNDYKKVIDAVKSLMMSINSKRKDKGLLPKKAKCLIVGVPRINEFMDLVDTPGILWPKFDNQLLALNLASMTIIKEEILTIEDVGIHILRMLDKYYKNILKKEFGIDYYNDDEIEELFIKISKHKNMPIKGEVDYERVCLLIVNSIKQEKIKEITFDRM